MPISYCKSTLDKVWKEEEELLAKTSSHKFRTYEDVSHWTFRYWQLCEGNFEPRNNKIGKYFNVSKNNDKLVKHIENQKTKMICFIPF